MNWEEINQIRDAVNKVNWELNTFEKLLPTPKDVELTLRQKTRLINFGGEIHKFLFGAATTEQMQNC